MPALDRSAGSNKSVDITVMKSGAIPDDDVLDAVTSMSPRRHIIWGAGEPLAMQVKFVVVISDSSTSMVVGSDVISAPATAMRETDSVIAAV